MRADPRIALFVLLLTAGGCGPIENEAAAPAIAEGRPSDLSTVVALYTTRTLPVKGGRTVTAIASMQSGVLLCPNAVLTVVHATEHGNLSVSNKSVVSNRRSALILNKQTRVARAEELDLAEPPDTVVKAAPITRMLVKTIREDGVSRDDGLAILKLERPYPSGLPYPSLDKYDTYKRNERTEVFGYGLDHLAAEYAEGDTVGMGVRRTASLYFTRYLEGRHLLFEGGGTAAPGDSGGPILRGAGTILQGTTIGLAITGRTFNSFVLNIILDQSYYWLRDTRDAICAGRSASSASSMGDLATARPSDPDVEIWAAGSSAEPPPVDEDEEVCLCEGPCEESCSFDDEAGLDESLDEDESADDGGYEEEPADDGGYEDEPADDDEYQEEPAAPSYEDCSCEPDGWCEDYWDDEYGDWTVCECDEDCWI